MKIYTKTGDTGTTALIGGERVPKYDDRVEAYGTVDELSAHIALLRDGMAAAGVEEGVDELLGILRTLMTVESLLAAGEGSEKKLAGIPEIDTAGLESAIDRMDALLPPMRCFTVPGGHPLSSQCHVCRTVCRRAERAAHRAAVGHDIRPDAIRYLNRLSDYLYMLGRRLCILLDAPETPWLP